MYDCLRDGRSYVRCAMHNVGMPQLHFQRATTGGRLQPIVSAPVDHGRIGLGIARTSALLAMAKLPLVAQAPK